MRMQKIQEWPPPVSEMHLPDVGNTPHNPTGSVFDSEAMRASDGTRGRIPCKHSSWQLQDWWSQANPSVFLNVISRMRSHSPDCV